MKQIFIGTFMLGHENTDLYGLPDDRGGSFYFVPDDTGRPRIKIGMDYDKWPEVITALIHEAEEFLLTRFHHRYTHTGDYGGGSDNVVFWFNHAQFGDMCGRLAYFLSNVLPKLAGVYNQQQKRKRKEVKKKLP